jgi:hypothetical protein
VAVLQEAFHSGGFSCRVAVANEMAAHWAFESVAFREEAGVVNAQQNSILCVNGVSVRDECRPW